MRTNPVKFRGTLVLAIVVLLVAVFTIRLIDIQVIQAAALTQQSVDKRSIPTTVYAKRGQITDKNGTVLADSVMRYNVTVSPKNAKDFLRQTDRSEVTITPQQAAIEIGTLTGQKPEDILKIIADALAENPKSDFAYIKKAVDVDTFRALNALEIPWLFFEQAPGRTYPNGAVAGNLLGFVGADGSAQAGLESGWDSCVAGVNGEEMYQRGADGVRIPGSTVTSVKSQNGGTLKLTIDSDLQWFVQQSLAKQVDKYSAEWGIAVVQEAKTGKLLAVADYPSLDPNNVDATDQSNRGSRAFMSPYEPGSTMKPITASMLIDSGVATPETQVWDPYYIAFPNGAEVTDAVMHGTLPLTLTGVLEQSSNVGMSQLGDTLAADKRYDYMLKFGLSSISDSGYPAESAGILASSDNWDNQTHYTVTFGQGVATTAIQMSSAYQALANNGKLIPATLVESCTMPDGTVVKPEASATTQVIKPQSARTVIDMMENFVTQGWINKEVTVPGYRVAMKTGTAQQPDGMGGYKANYVVSNMGMIPAEDPQYIITVVIAEPKVSFTSMVCPPLFKAIEQQVIKRYRIKPSQGEAPVLPIRF
ncbi:peptidoglycan D,D-transpeptidase FtsI family protein [Aurantimicrobium minutum]|uniref:peptidoglycan D,D-transpeptidase FtsI family protein n=1 Tax=Aurantimicrobium minutum TaxID=708131 RepID=UPI002476117F|nr:penicillin-binding protein 2 [Aurantimicrobium minutum]MDH6422436.1 cell division protein FtsI (penicillin-binding protein 3) [Aurantimicrobium minutum]